MERFPDINAIPRHKVESNNLSEIGYDEDSKILVVKFHSGGLYGYMNVRKDIYDSLNAARSKGKFFIANIKTKYEFRKVA